MAENTRKFNFRRRINMIRKSDTVELSELEKFGFKYGTRDKF